MPIKVAFLDCDGTLTKVRSSWEYLHKELGLWDENADEFQELFRAGEIDYHEFCRRDARLWRGLSVPEVREIVGRIPYRDDAMQTVENLKKMGVVTVIISSGLSLLVDRVQADLAIDLAVSNELVAHEGYFTGDVRINVGYNCKDRIVANVLRDLGLKKEESCAVGDGDGDRSMFDTVGLPINLATEGKMGECPEHAHSVTNLADVIELVGRCSE